MSEEEDDFKVTDADKVKAAAKFLKDAPLLEFQEVHKEVKSLLGSQDLLARAMKDTVPEHWETLHAPIGTGKDPPFVLLSAAGKLDDGSYACPTSNLAYTVDWAKQTASESRELTDDEQKQIGVEDEARADLVKVMTDYISDHHEGGGKGVGKFAVYKKGDDYVICVHADKANKPNMWTGTYTTTATLSGGDATFSTRIQLHYWEDGNVQLNSNWEAKAKVKTGKALAANFVKELTKHVNEYHKRLSQDFNDMSSATLKNLRRVLPITKQQIQWGKLDGYKLSKDGS